MHCRRVLARPARRPVVLALAAGLVLAPATLTACSSGATTASGGGTAGASGGAGSSSASSTSSASPTSTGEADAPSPGTLLARTKAAVEAARSSHVAGTVEDSGKAVTIDVSGQSDGSSAQGSVQADGAHLEFVLVGGQTYLRGDARFWTAAGAPAARATQLASSKKWVKASAAQAQSFTQLANPKTLLAELLDGSGASSVTQKVEATSVAGEPCWSITDRIGSNDAALDVATSSSLPVRLVIGAGQGLTFGDWNSVPVPTAPAAADVISAG